MIRLPFRILAVLSWFLLCIGAASAQDVCAQLRGQLAAINQAGGAAVQYQRQQAVYNDAYRQAQQMGCMTLLRIFAPPQCQSVRQNLDQLGAQLRVLERAARGVTQPAVPRSSIVAALAANGCATPSSGATYRTLCVRPGDGFYFPVSFATRPDQFEADQRTCQAQCVGATLFVHRNPGETMEEAVDLPGNRYADLPTAFLFQTRYDPNQHCRTDPAFLAAIAPAPAAGLAAAETTVPVPLPRPERSEDPETLANRSGGLIFGPATADYLVANGIRLIGPAYYYAMR